MATVRQSVSAACVAVSRANVTVYYTPMISRRSVLIVIGMAVLASKGSTASPKKVRIETADGRISEISIYRATYRKGTILFSHGAFSAPWKYDALIAAWVDAGFDVWAPLHVDSTDHPATKRYSGMASWPARIEDMRALAAHVGARRWVAAGHSYGALVALTLGGASPTRPDGVDGALANSSVSSVVAFSPPGPGMGPINAGGYATLAVPALIQTGTQDIPPGAAPEGWRAHLAAYEAASAGKDRYALVLDGADHYFGGLICRPELPGPKQIAQFTAARDISTLFLGAYGARSQRSLNKLSRKLGSSGGTLLSRK